jgi:hypothetical protein
LSLVDGIIVGSVSVVLHVVHRAFFLTKVRTLPRNSKPFLEFVGSDSVNHTVHHDVHVVQVHNRQTGPLPEWLYRAQVWLFVLIDLKVKSKIDGSVMLVGK